MNIIDAIINLVTNPVTKLAEYYQGRNRANNAGDALEEYVKDLFAGTFDTPAEERLRIHNEVFSYLGNNSNPPDAILKNGDAIEVKKTEADNAPLALNSSYPKHKLTANSPMISTACRNAEQWVEKDILYVVGTIAGRTNRLKQLCMVYGTEYCASGECYERIRRAIKEGVEAIEGIDFSESRELGHINKVDPLGITYMRVRGMWGISNPLKAFDYIYSKDHTKAFNFMCIISEEKWKTLERKDELVALSESRKGLSISGKQVKDPDNPAKLINVKLITFSV